MGIKGACSQLGKVRGRDPVVNVISKRTLESLDAFC